MPMPAFAPVLRPLDDDDDEDDGVGVEVCEIFGDVVPDVVERVEVDEAVIGNCEVVKSFRPDR
jgi:hypothetical protein